MAKNFSILFFKKKANLKKIFFYIKFFFTIIFLSLSSQVYASSILGTGSGALIGGDLTDPENDGIDGTDGAAGNWNWTSIAASSDGQWGGEGAWNAFDNKVGGGDAKWCCNNPTQWVYVQFSQAYVLSHFTITSGNDVPSRDPDIWKIQGSNNGNDWTDIFSYNNDGNSPFSARHQVIRYNGAGDDFDTPAAYSYFRYIVTSTGTSMHQINELEFFGTADSTAPTLSSSTPSDNATAIAADANIVLNFSESVDAESGNITIKKTSDNSIFETIDVTSGQVSGSGSSQITVNPSTNFSANTEYYVLVDASAFDDASSGSYAGISSTTALSCTVDTMKDPKKDKDVIGSIDTLGDQVKGVFTQSVSVVSNRLIYLRNNRTNNSFSNQNMKISFGQDIINSSDILDSFFKLVPISNQLPENIIPEYWSSWTEGTISMTKVGDQENSSSKEINAQGLAMGMDKKINDNELFGFSAHYTQSDTEIGTTGSAVDTQFYSVTAYGTKPHNNNNFIEGSFGIGLIKSDLVRKNGSNVLTGSRNGKQLFGSINYGKTIVDKEYNVIPRVRIDLSYTELDNYDESGTDALSYSDQTLENGLASLGLTINKETLVDDKKINRFGTFELGADFSNSSSATMHYLSDVSTTYSISQGVDSNYLATSEFGLTYDVKDNLKVLSSYKRIQGNNSEHTDILKFSFNFKSLRETEYAVIMDATEYLSAGLNIGKNINGIDLDFNANQSFIKNSKKQANIKLSKKF